MPGPGAVILYPQAAFIRGSMVPLGERTPSPVTGRGERDSGVITWIPSIGWWYCCSLPLVDIGSCLPRDKGQDHSCFSQAISSGTAKCAPTELGLMSLPLFPLYPSLSRLPPVNYIDIMETGQRPPTRFPPPPLRPWEDSGIAVLTTTPCAHLFCQPNPPPIAQRLAGRAHSDWTGG